MQEHVLSPHTIKNIKKAALGGFFNTVKLQLTLFFLLAQLWLQQRL